MPADLSRERPNLLKIKERNEALTGRLAAVGRRRIGDRRGAGALRGLRPVPALRAVPGAPDRRHHQRGGGQVHAGQDARLASASPGTPSTSCTPQIPPAPQRPAGAPVRVLPPGPPGVPPHLHPHRRDVDAGGAAAGAASGSRSSPTTCGATARSLYQRMGDMTTLDHRPVRHRQGTGGARHRPVALHPVRREDADVRRATSRSRSTPLNLSALSPTLSNPSCSATAAGPSPAR